MRCIRIAILAYDMCLPSGVSGFADVFSVAGHVRGQHDITGDFAVSVLSHDGHPVHPSGGLPVAVHGQIGEASEGLPWDVVYVPPSLGPGVHAPGLTDWLAATHASGSVVCGACAGVFLLAAAGLLDGRQATTHWGLEREFRLAYPGIPLDTRRMLIDHGDVVCAGGLTAYFDLALHLVTRFAGRDLTLACARTLLLDPGRVHQSPYMDLAGSSRHGDALVAEVQRVIEEGHTKHLSVGDLAAAVHTTPRTLLRRFSRALGTSPAAYLQAVRMEHAKRLLEATGQPVTSVALEVGYRDVPAFFRAFRELTGLTPKDYRARFGLTAC